METSISVSHLLIWKPLKISNFSISFQDVCDAVVCKNYAVCHKKDGKAVCECPEACPLIYKPVCGSDGRTYANECIMKSTSCLDDRVIKVSRKGTCGMYKTPFSRDWIKIYPNLELHKYS